MYKTKLSSTLDGEGVTQTLQPSLTLIVLATQALCMALSLTITLDATLNAHDVLHPDEGPAASAPHPSSFSCGVGSCHNPTPKHSPKHNPKHNPEHNPRCT
jgi:hypothetical protein